MKVELALLADLIDVKKVQDDNFILHLFHDTSNGPNEKESESRADVIFFGDNSEAAKKVEMHSRLKSMGFDETANETLRKDCETSKEEDLLDLLDSTI